MEQLNGLNLGKIYQSHFLLPYLFILYAEMDYKNAQPEEIEIGIEFAGKSITLDLLMITF